MQTRQLQKAADCPANFDLIRSWLAKCNAHPVCGRALSHASSFNLPTRLIDVGLPTSTSHPRLVFSVNLDLSSDCRYVALSHCWGDPSTIPQTRTASLQRHQDEITQLSKTFKDAIKVTREMEIRYMWIDSLCIIQDEQADFEKECANMHLIYSRAYFTLSALDSVDGSGGLFHTRDPSAVEAAKPIDWSQALAGPLSTRGWAFQEQQLSPRIIHFSKLRIMWECRVAVAFEDRPNMCWRGVIPSGRVQGATWRLLDGKTLALENMGQEKYNDSVRRMSDVYSRWLRCMEIYSARALSHLSDRLPAISGLAAALASADSPESNLRDPSSVNDMYLSGIWKRDICRSLVWRQVEDTSSDRVSRQHGPPHRIEGIPSWSWASIYGGVIFLAIDTLDVLPFPNDVEVHSQVAYRAQEPNFEFIEASKAGSTNDPSTLNRFGEVIYNTIKLRSQMAEVWVAVTAAQESVMPNVVMDQSGMAIPNFKAYFDFNLPKTSTPRITWLNRVVKFVKAGWGTIFSTSSDSSSFKLFCFDILRESRFTLSNRMPGRASGLLLRATPDGNYQRVGIYERVTGSGEFNSQFEVATVSIE